MSKIKKMFEPDQLLPKELVLKSADSHLYRIGLCVPTDDSYIKRKFIQKPIFILAVILIETCKIIVFSSYSSAISEKSRVYLGDYGELTRMGNFYRLIVGTYISVTICSMAIHYWNNKNGVNPTYLLVFKMMAGLVPPKTVGLTDETQILWLIRRARFVFRAVFVNSYVSVPILTFLFGFVGYLRIDCKLFEVVIFGLPHSLYLILLIYLLNEIQAYQLIYFYIICVYLKMKLQSINAKLLEKKSKTSIAYIVSQLKAMNSLYKEINEYNSQFWSLYFLLFWLIIGSMISIDLYVIFISNIGIVYKICVIYSMLSFFLLFLFMVFTASSVNYEAKKAYKLLNRLFVSMFVEKSLQKNKTLSVSHRMYSIHRITWVIKVIYFQCSICLFYFQFAFR